MLIFLRGKGSQTIQWLVAFQRATKLKYCLSRTGGLEGKMLRKAPGRRGVNEKKVRNPALREERKRRSCDSYIH